MPIYIHNRRVNNILLTEGLVREVRIGKAGGATDLISINTYRKPVISSFNASPNPLDLDVPANITNRLRFVFSARTNPPSLLTPGSSLRLRAGIYLHPEHALISPSYVSSNSSMNENLTIDVPRKTQAYRLIVEQQVVDQAGLVSGSNTSIRDLTVVVTENPAITSLRRTGFQQGRAGLSENTFVFEATIKGYPQPILSYRFGSGQSGSISAGHLTPVAGQFNTWNMAFRVVHPTLNDSLIVTATNSSGSVSSTIGNISS